MSRGLWISCAFLALNRYGLQIFRIVEIEASIKSRPVLVRENPAPILEPHPPNPLRGWGRHYPDQTVAFGGRGKYYLLELLLLATELPAIVPRARIKLAMTGCFIFLLGSIRLW